MGKTAMAARAHTNEDPEEPSAIWLGNKSKISSHIYIASLLCKTNSTGARTSNGMSRTVSNRIWKETFKGVLREKQSRDLAYFLI